MNPHFAPRIGEALVYLGLGVGMVLVQAMGPAHVDGLLNSAAFESISESMSGGPETASCDTSGGTLSWLPGGRSGFVITGLGEHCAGKRVQVTLRGSDGQVLGTAHSRVSAASGDGAGHRANFSYPALGGQAAEISSVQVHLAD